ncbi:MAG: TIGR02452 family protein [Oscillospiraceae bacterium]
MGRIENQEIFFDTERLCENDPILSEAIKNSATRQRSILQGASIAEQSGNKSNNPGRVIVSKKRSFTAASAYADKKVCVLNFASATNPGGGVEKGSSAQEESLCRCSTLYFNLNDKKPFNDFYYPHRKSGNPLHNDDCIYTPDVVVFKSDTDTPRLLPQKSWYSVNVITCAAPNLRPRPSNSPNHHNGNEAIQISDRALEELHEKRLRRILNIALLEGNEVIILGAFGCGAFLNPPQVVAAAAKKVTEEYRDCFDVIEFAVYCNPRDDSNYRVFERVFKPELLL